MWKAFWGVNCLNYSIVQHSELFSKVSFVLQQEIIPKILQSQGKFHNMEENLAKLEENIVYLQVSFMNKGNVTMGALEGTPYLSDRLRNICFIRGLASDRIQTIVRNQKYQT